MQRVYRYVYRMAEHFNATRPQVIVNYKVAGLGMLTGMGQGEYIVRAKTRERIEVLTLSFVCAGEGPAVFQIDPRYNTQNLRDYLYGRGLRFNSRQVFGGDQRKAAGVRFDVDRRVPVFITFQPDVQSERIRLTLKNLEELADTEYPLPPDAISEDLLDELAKAVIRKPNRFKELIGYGVPDEIRQRLKARLQREGEGRQEPSAPSPPSAQAEARRKGILGQLLGSRRGRDKGD
jgi:hypothetical protein